MPDLSDLLKDRFKEKYFILFNLMGPCMTSEGSAEVLQWFDLIYFQQHADLTL
jgi:hypothetical protein